MPTAIIKIVPDVDEYVLWSTVVDDVASPPMTRADLERKMPIWGYESGPERFERADETGSSWTFNADGFGQKMLTQAGWVPRENLREYAIRVNRGDPVDHLLEPFEDGD